LKRPVIVIRPEPGASATAVQLVAAAVPALIAPLFQVEPVSWKAPPVEDYDALLLTSANAVRHGGEQLFRLRHLPCWCVGEVTAAVAREAAFRVSGTGTGNAMELLSEAPTQRWLWLAGERHQSLVAPAGSSLRVIPVYASVHVPPSPDLLTALAAPAIIMVHSAVAGAHLAALVTERHRHQLVVISKAAANEVGVGWGNVVIAAHPSDREMVALAVGLCQNSSHG
jgi:uroporphyrinogen-III synthase